MSHVACPIAHHRQLRSISACTPCVVVVKYIVWNVEGYSKSALPKPTNLSRFEMAGGKWNSPWYSFNTIPPQKKTTGRILEVSQGKGTNHLRMFSPLLVCTCLHQHFDTKTILKTSSLYNWVPHFNPASVTGSSRTLCESQILGPRKISQISQTSEVLILR